MIVQVSEGYLVSCDFCSTETQVRADDFSWLTKHILSRGWKIETGEKRGEHLHRCPCCVEDQQPIVHYIKEGL